MHSISEIAEKLRRYKRQTIVDPAFTASAVLIPITSSNLGLELLLTKRTEMVEHHKGQISFPGGATDPRDKSPVETALRESFEEIGLDSKHVSLLGMIDDLKTPSGFVVTPVVGYIELLPSLRLNREEVDRVILLPLEKFLDPTTRRSETRRRAGQEIEVYFYDVWEEPVWGATAFFVKNLVDVITR